MRAASYEAPVPVAPYPLVLAPDPEPYVVAPVAPVVPEVVPDVVAPVLEPLKVPYPAPVFPDDP